MVKFAVEFQFSCKKKDGYLYTINRLMEKYNYKDISKSGLYVGSISSSENENLIDIFYDVVMKLNNISSKDCIISLNNDVDTRICMMFLPQFDNTLMYEKFKTLIDYSLHLMTPIYMKYFSQINFEYEPLNFKTILDSNIVITNHLPSALIEDDKSKNVIKFISKLANYISTKIVEEEEDSVKTHINTMITEFMVQYATDYYKYKFSLPISKLIDFYDKQDYITIVMDKPDPDKKVGDVSKSVKMYGEVMRYFNSIKKKTLVVMASTPLFNQFKEIPSFLNVEDKILFYPGIIVAQNKRDIVDVADIVEKNKLQSLVDLYVETKSKELVVVW